MQQMPRLEAKGWRLRGLGGYFAYMEHPFAISSGDLAPLMVADAGILCLPGTMFYPDDTPQAKAELRIAFANLDAEGISTLFDRLEALDLDRR